MIVPRTPSIFNKRLDTSCTTASVRASEAPAGGRYPENAYGREHKSAVADQDTLRAYHEPLRQSAVASAEPVESFVEPVAGKLHTPNDLMPTFLLRVRPQKYSGQGRRER
ncbi:hypothetical protein G6F40_016979 [Rhizopus arrhizus]|nr:hypothetical protein G6F40_016979 [Rhizopus arrhizus]